MANTSADLVMLVLERDSSSPVKGNLVMGHLQMSHAIRFKKLFCEPLKQCITRFTSRRRSEEQSIPLWRHIHVDRCTLSTSPLHSALGICRRP